MIDPTRSLLITGSSATRTSNGPARLITVDGHDIVVRSVLGHVLTFDARTGSPSAGNFRSALRLENEPIRTTTRMYARRSTARPGEIKLQSVRPVTSIGEIEIDVENNRIVAARVVS